MRDTFLSNADVILENQMTSTLPDSLILLLAMLLEI
jgi:hypothetical protein